MRWTTSIAVLICLTACTTGKTDTPSALIGEATLCGRTISHGQTLADIPVEGVEFVLKFTRDVAPTPVGDLYFSGGDVSVERGADSRTLVVRPLGELSWFRNYTLAIPAGKAFGVKIPDEYEFSFTTAYDPSDKFPRISDDELLTLVQRQTFKYFWDYAHPDCGLARERMGSDNTVTIGGSGFGIMCLPVAVERGFVTRDQAAARLRKIVTFLKDKADRFHGAYSHWLDGSTGKVVPFGTNDNGGDLVETSFLVMGLLSAAGYFDAAGEADIRSAIDEIWRGVEWDWYTQGKKVLYWHWSPDKDWAMNMKIYGWNEGLMAYVLGASSPTHPVSAEAYHQGWASKGSMKMTTDGPLFFAHYSFMGLDPHGLKDTYCADYWAQNVAHARYNYEYCVRNPKGHAGYSADSWGLTASDIPGGYTASAPSNDRGTIAPTAAVASYPYLPEESLRAIRYFYYVLGDKLWGDYGFRDAFNMDKRWFAGSYIAIDQGPIVVMIENARSGLLWNCFMKHPDVQKGLAALGFSKK